MQTFIVYSETPTTRGPVLITTRPMNSDDRGQFQHFLCARECETIEDAVEEINNERGGNRRILKLKSPDEERPHTRLGGWIDHPDYREACRRRRLREKSGKYEPKKKPELIVGVRCCGEIHKIALFDGRLVLLHHPPDELKASRDMQLLADDTEFNCRCLEVRKAWANFDHTSAIETLPDALLGARLNTKPPMKGRTLERGRRNPIWKSRKYPEHVFNQSLFRKELRLNYATRRGGGFIAEIAESKYHRATACTFRHSGYVDLRLDNNELAVATDIDNWLLHVWLKNAVHPDPDLVIIQAIPVNGSSNLMIARAYHLHKLKEVIRGILHLTDGRWQFHATNNLWL